MDEKFRGIVVSAKDYNEKDKLITIYTVEKGLVNILAKGIKNSNAKLKYAKELFTFADFFTTAKGSFYILTGCDLIDNFSELKEKPEKFMEASNITNLLKNVCQYGEGNIQLLLEYINAIKTLCYENVVTNIVLSKFMIILFENAGYKLSLTKCANCQQNFFGKKYLNLDSGEIVCSACKTQNNIEVDELMHSNLRLLSTTEFNKLHSIKLKNLEQTTQFLITNYKFRFNKNFTLY